METDPRPHGRVFLIMRRSSLAAITALVAASAVTSFAESYRGLFLWASGHGLTGPWSVIWPLQVDTFIAVGELALVVALADGWSFRSRIAAWAVTLTGLAASVAGNIGHAAGHDWTVRATAAVPPLAAAAALAVGLGVLKRLADRAIPAEPVRTPAPAVAVASPEPVMLPATPATVAPLPAIPLGAPAALDPAKLAALDSGAKRARLAAATLGTVNLATVADALADAGHPVTTEAIRSALRNRPRPGQPDETNVVTLARTSAR
jgi:hypothetical protein